MHFDSTDLNINYEHIRSSYKQLPPIILIPGVAGSKLYGKHRDTNEDECCWIQPSLKAVQKMSQFMWGYMDREDGLFKSFVDEWAEVHAYPGLSGCDHIIDTTILEAKMFKNVGLDNYFMRLANHLITNLGYEYLTNLFAYTYDWRQSLD